MILEHLSEVLSNDIFSFYIGVFDENRENDTESAYSSKKDRDRKSEFHFSLHD